MKKSLMNKWVKALRSDKYIQGTSELKTKSDGTVSHCCLGVLCEVAGVKISYEDGLLTEEQQKLLGFYSEDGILPKGYRNKYGENVDSLAALNDGGLSFKQIARIIETNYKTL